jgi:8-oxo-dGTP pyrophosphatase MutT (NUDIX family)
VKRPNLGTAPVGIVANAIKLRRGGRYGYYYGPAVEQRGDGAPAGGSAETPAGGTEAGGTPAERA